MEQEDQVVEEQVLLQEQEMQVHLILEEVEEVHVQVHHQQHLLQEEPAVQESLS